MRRESLNVAALPISHTQRDGGLGLSGAIAWRNLWRNRLRTTLTAGGIAFAVTLIVAAYSLQGGAMDAMADHATQLFTGHLQIQNPAYADDPSLRNLVPDATAVARALKSVPGVTAVAQRAVGFALVSVGERSYGAQVTGIDPQAEPAVSSLADLVVKGRYIVGPGDALLGSVIARNLGVDVGDELVVLGSRLDGSVAALSLHVSGIVESGSAELDRVLVQIQLAAFQDEFGLGDQVHMVVARVSDFEHVDATLPAVDAAHRAARNGERRVAVAAVDAGGRANDADETRRQPRDDVAGRGARDVQHFQQLHDDGVRTHP